MPNITARERPCFRELIEAGWLRLTDGSLKASRLSTKRSNKIQRWVSSKRLITGYCAACGYQLNGWRVIPGRKQSATFYSAKRVDVAR